MARVILRSLFSMLLAAFVGSLVVFTLLRSIGGDVAHIILGQYATEGALEALEAAVEADVEVSSRRRAQPSSARRLWHALGDDHR